MWDDPGRGKEVIMNYDDKPCVIGPFKGHWMQCVEHGTLFLDMQNCPENPERVRERDAKKLEELNRAYFEGASAMAAHLEENYGIEVNPRLLPPYGGYNDLT
jgi:hypothetical protein